MWGRVEHGQLAGCLVEEDTHDGVLSQKGHNLPLVEPLQDLLHIAHLQELVDSPVDELWVEHQGEPQFPGSTTSFPTNKRYFSVDFSCNRNVLYSPPGFPDQADHNLTILWHHRNHKIFLTMIGLESYMVQSVIGLESYMVQSVIGLESYMVQSVIGLESYMVQSVIGLESYMVQSVIGLESYMVQSVIGLESYMVHSVIGLESYMVQLGSHHTLKV